MRYHKLVCRVLSIKSRDVWHNDRAIDSGPKGTVLKLARVNWFFPWKSKLIVIARWSFSLGMLIGLKPHQFSPPVSAGVRFPVYLDIKTSTWCREMTARSYALHSVYPQLVFFSFSRRPECSIFSTLMMQFQL